MKKEQNVMYKEIEPFYEPLDIFEKIGKCESELSKDEMGFICGIIKKFYPCKIVEIGVSGGYYLCDYELSRQVGIGIQCFIC